MTAPTIYSIALDQAVRDDRISVPFSMEVHGWIATLVERCEDYEAAERDATQYRDMWMAENARAEAAEREVARLNLPENRGIGDTEIVAVLKERDQLRLEVELANTYRIGLVDHLMAALRKYGHHTGCADECHGALLEDSCAKWVAAPSTDTGQRIDEAKPCTCGLDAALGPAPAEPDDERPTRDLRPLRELDLELLAKLASGEGGRRTGALKRAGLLEWTVTPRGLAALLTATGATLSEAP